MYSLNNIALSNFGIIPGQIEGSNLAVSGMLDMPARIGKTYQDWADEPGVQPYVLASEIRHGGRAVKFKCLMLGQDKATVYAMLDSFYSELESYTDLVPFTTPWSSHLVYIKKNIEARYIGAGNLELLIEFEEPVVPNLGNFNTGAEENKTNIDGVALEDLGMFLTVFNSHLNRAKRKEAQYTSYATQGYKITPVEALELEIEIIAHGANFDAVKANIASLQKVLSAPGTRNLKIDGKALEVFNVKGFEVSNIKVSDSLAMGTIRLPLMMNQIGNPVIIADLTDNYNNELVNNLLQQININ